MTCDEACTLSFTIKRPHKRRLDKTFLDYELHFYIMKCTEAITLVVLCLANVEAGAGVLCLELSQTVYLQSPFSKITAPFDISERQTNASKHSQDEHTNTNRRDSCSSLKLLLSLKEKRSTYPFLLKTLSHALRFGPSKHKQGTVVKVDKITANKNVSSTNLGWKRKPVNLSKMLEVHVFTSVYHRCKSIYYSRIFLYFTLKNHLRPTK